MAKSLIIVCIVAAICAVIATAEEEKIVYVELGRHCALGAAPVGPGGSWQTVENNVKKICPEGSSCRKGACNCDNLADGTVMSISTDDKGTAVCRRVAGQKCASSSECYNNVQCTQGVCTCPSDPKFRCVNSKDDVTILAK